ncbi:MAG: potassium/proton antiporter [Kineosporiaceae bacterium]|nr:potassium/proton antiporter [Aeromicrobium sp.]
MNSEDLDTYLLIGSGVLVLAILAVRVSMTAGLPSLLFYLGIGLAIGSSGLGIQFANADLALALGLAALVLILAEGGVTTKWDNVRTSMRLGLLLATIGVTVSVVIVALGAHYILGLDWQLAVLLAAVTSPTDAAAVFSVLRAVPLKYRISGVLESESGLNDAPIVVLVVAISAGELADKSPAEFLLLILFELIAGAAIGFGIGRIGALMLRLVALPASGLYPIAILAFSVLAYGAAASLHTSGFAAVYLAALVLGNADLPHRAATRSFAEGIGSLAQIGLFVMLGLLANPGEIRGWHVWTAIAMGAILTFVARPLSILVSSIGQKYRTEEKVFIAWAGLRGAVPIILATIPLAAGVKGSRDLFNIVLVFVIIYTVIQAPTLGWLARRTNVLTDAARDVEVEAAPLENISADLLQIHIPSGSKLVGVEISELRLPKGVSISLVVRNGETLVPHHTTRIQLNDDLLIVSPRAVREATEQRLRDVGRKGRLAGW